MIEVRRSRLAPAPLGLALLRGLLTIAVLLIGLTVPGWADFDDGWRAYRAGDYAQAYREWLPLAQQGNGEAGYWLGQLYQSGRGVSQNDSEAMRWYRLAAEQGWPTAQYFLARLYEGASRELVAPNYPEAMRWYYIAAQQRNDLKTARWARGALGRMYHDLGEVYENNATAPRDRLLAYAWYELAASTVPELGGFIIDRNRAGSVLTPAEQATAQQMARGWDPIAPTSLPVLAGAPVPYAVPTPLPTGLTAPQIERYTDKDGQVTFTNVPPRDHAEVVLAAEGGDPASQFILGTMYEQGRVVGKNLVLAYVWYVLAANQPGEQRSASIARADAIGRRLYPEQLARAQQIVREWRPKPEGPVVPSPRPALAARPGELPLGPRRLRGTGTGFIVSESGHVLTNAHVVEDCAEVRTALGSEGASLTPIIATDQRNDLALGKRSSSLPITAIFREGGGVRQGEAIVAMGFPLRGLLAAGPTLTTGTVSALAGLGNDTRYLQITAPVQPGSSGGPLLDQSGNIVGVVVGKLDALKVAEATGDIPQNVNFAIKVSVIRAFLDASGVDHRFAPSTRTLSAPDIGDLAKKFTVVVECWK